MFFAVKYVKSFLFLLILTLSAAVHGATELVFSGTPANSGSRWHWTNVGSLNGQSVDVVLRVTSQVNLTDLQVSTSGDDALVRIASGGVGSVTASYEFYESGYDVVSDTGTPITIIPLSVFKDIDLASSEMATVQKAEVASYAVESDPGTFIVVTDNGTTIDFTGNDNSQNATSVRENQVRVDFQPTDAVVVTYSINNSTGRNFLFDGDIDTAFVSEDKTQLDTTPPAAPSVDSQLTNDTTPVITGNAEAFSTVSVTVGGATFSVVAESDTSWSLDTGTVTPDSGTFNPDVNGVNQVVAVATDAAGNASPQDADSNELTIDSTVPTVAIQNVPADTNSNSFTATFEFSEDVNDFVLGDITVGNGTASNFTAVDGNTYTALITATAEGNVTVDVNASVATDDAGNNNTAATQAVANYDITNPTVAIQNVPADTNSNSFTATFEFSENVNDFVLGDITVGNGTASNFTAVDGNTYTALITATAEGNVTVDVNASVATDDAGNNNTAATQAVANYDITNPTVAIQNVPADSNGAFTTTFEFSEDVNNFVVGDISVTNGAASNFTVIDGNTYTATITPAAEGNVVIDVNANVAQDNAGNNNTAAQATSNYDITQPSVAIQNVPADTNSSFTATFEFSEDVNGFVVGDITVGNGTASNFTAVDGNTYTALITPSAEGNVTLDVNASVATDDAGNNNTAATQAVANYDISNPGVVIQNVPADSNAAFTATFEFSEDVNNFVVGDISATNASVSNFSAVDGNTYTATITPTAEGAVTLDVNANVATDDAGNNNTAAT
ncbi:beta strand repeat-containing protein, partial [Pleionea mediterranea]